MDSFDGSGPIEEFPQLVMFNDYFVETWLGEDAKISMEMWNVYTETERRTNNHVEGRNSKFMNVVGKHHPNMFQFVEALKRVQAATELNVAQHDTVLHMSFTLYFPLKVSDSYIYNYIILMTFEMCLLLIHFTYKPFSSLK